MTHALVIAEALGGHSAAHQSQLWWFALGLFAACVTTLVFTLRRLRSQVELEEADAILDEHSSWDD